MRFKLGVFILAVSFLALGWVLPVHGDTPVMALPWNPPVLDCIKTAQQVYVFPNTDTQHPTRDDKHMRLLDPEARAALVGLLDDKDGWWQGLYALRFPNSPHADLGFVFKSKGCELVLFFTGQKAADATLGDMSTSGLLNEDASRKLKEWGARYAQLELSVPSVPPPVVTHEAPSNITMVNGIAVSGDDLSQISASDIHQVFAAFEDAGLSHPYTVFVNSKDEIRGYLQPNEWMTARRVTCATTGSGQHPCWKVQQNRLPEYSDAMRCIRGANYVHIFPTSAPLEHSRNFSYPDTMLGDSARNELTELLGAKESWSEASDSSMPPPGKLPTNMGFELIDIDKNGRCEVNLFFSPDGKVQGDLDDEYLSGTLGRTAAQALQAWYAKYAQAELDASRETPAPSPSSK